MGRIGMAAMALWAVATACEKDIAVGGEGTFDNRNVFVRGVTQWENRAFRKDSLLVDASGHRFYVDEVRLLLSKFFVNNQGDTIYDPESFALITEVSDDYPVLKLNPGSYSGSVGFRIGLDSVTNSRPLGASAPGSLLNEPSLYRGATGGYKGYRFLEVKGRVFNPRIPDEVEPSRTFHYELGDTLDLNFKLSKSFSSGESTPIVFAMILDLDSLLAPFDLDTVSEIRADRSDVDDYNRALQLRQAAQNAIILL